MMYITATETFRQGRRIYIPPWPYL